MIIIPFDATFTKADPDYRPFIKYELREQEAVERLILLGVKGLQRILENNTFTVPKKAVDALEEYEKENNSSSALLRIRERTSKTTKPKMFITLMAHSAWITG
jgi:putative DNA primase/helicase